MTTDKFCLYLQNSLIQTSQTGGQWCSDTSPSSIPWLGLGEEPALERCTLRRSNQAGFIQTVTYLGVFAIVSDDEKSITLTPEGELGVGVGRGLLAPVPGKEGGFDGHEVLHQQVPLFELGQTEKN